jgi:hypothetical protein
MKTVTNITEDLEVISFFDLSESDKKEFEDQEDSSFFSAYGQIWDLGMFTRTSKDNTFSGNWGGIYHLGSDSGVLVKVSPCGGSVTVGRF